MTDHVMLCEMSPRDGMQVLNRSCRVPIELRIALLQALQRARLPYIEAGSFVSARFLPQFQDTAELISAARLPDYRGQLAVLVPNVSYYERSRDAAKFDTIALFLSASEEYSQKNKKRSIAEDLADATQLLAAARLHGHRVRAHLSAAFRDPILQTQSDAEIVRRICRQLVDSGCEYVALADTDGRATRADLERIIPTLEVAHIGVHLHDRFGQAMENAALAFDMGVRIFDSAAAGIGGNAAVIDSAGNIATESLARMFAQRGVETGIDLIALADALKIIEKMAALVGEPHAPTGNG